MPNRERLPQKSNSPERAGAELGETTSERLEQLKNRQETVGERPDSGAPERTAENARKDAEAAFDSEPGHEQASVNEPTTAPDNVGSVTRLQKKTGYDKTMKSVRTQLSKRDRAFSEVIHQPSIEKISEAASVSIARPNAILAGSFTAFVAVSCVYMLAHYNGFELSGSETIAAFAIGWVVGIGLDLMRVAFKRRHFR